MPDFKFRPIRILDKGVCPKCMRTNLCVKSFENNYYILDQNGNPKHNFATVPMYMVMCPNKQCGFKSTNWEFVNGIFKYLSPIDKIAMENRIRENDKISLDIINIEDTNTEVTFSGNPLTIEKDS